MEINKASSKVKRQSRRSFLGQLGVGVVGIATLSSGLLGFAPCRRPPPRSETIITLLAPTELSFKIVISVPNNCRASMRTSVWVTRIVQLIQ